jgi:hypothetical protein
VAVRRAAALALVGLAAAAGAVEVAGIEFPQQGTGPGGVALSLCGAGIRQRFVFDVYAVGLYLPACTRDAEQAIAAAGPKRVAMQMLRDVGADDFVEALETNLRNNHDAAQMQALAPGIARLEAIMSALGTVTTGTRIALDLVPGTGTVVAIDGRARGAPIPGEDFYRALLRNWLGRRPVSESLKRELLGGE